MAFASGLVPGSETDKRQRYIAVSECQETIAHKRTRNEVSLVDGDEKTSKAPFARLANYGSLWRNTDAESHTSIDHTAGGSLLGAKEFTITMVHIPYHYHCRMNLIEPVRVPEQLSKASRQRIISSIAELECKIYANDIYLADLYPRNVIVIDHDSPDPSVVFVDFDDTLFQRAKDDNKLWDVSERCLGQYKSPLLRWKARPANFVEWVDWGWDSWLQEEFAWTESSITPEIREVFTFD
ncbi:hypothetical protein N7481_008187 [Penicillium waksmanii]|uniref:uncharacterized protein n=1 Tax=Penicillium waksmanii TaxID=69791 RepID=UPI002548AFF5|nr:uncharacterized protein N7481_008187 [Penicillium waksmanii]KAJ5980889.1 hypothetical protein N7481_008187 [Penicillium waksmanii]